jgi:hypothetical protein
MAFLPRGPLGRVGGNQSTGTKSFETVFRIVRRNHAARFRILAGRQCGERRCFDDSPRIQIA